MTMDILWAISHPVNGNVGSPLVTQSFPGTFAVQTPPYADGTKEVYEDFVGGVQFWGYGLVSGSGDGAVRMWDSKPSHDFYRRVADFCDDVSAHGTSAQNVVGPYGTGNMSPVRRNSHCQWKSGQNAEG
jgi:hypothetical protein